MQRSSTANANGSGKDVIEFTLKPRSSKLRLSATHITATADESQHSLCKQIADIAHLPLNRLRVTFETSNRVIDKRFHPDTAPKVGDVANEGNVLIIKDLGPSLSLQRSLLQTVCHLIVFSLDHGLTFRTPDLMADGVCGRIPWPNILPSLVLLLPTSLLSSKLRPFLHANVPPNPLPSMNLPFELYTHFPPSLTMTMVVLHFLKREFETLFIHRFSADTMPLAYIIRNSAHYWILCGIIFGYIVNHPYYSVVHRSSTQTHLTIILFVYFELSNLWTHLTLRGLRPDGTRTRQIPRGYGFDWPFGGLSFPNYFFDFMVWVVVAEWTWCWGIIPFIAVAMFIMDRWSQQVLPFSLSLSLCIFYALVPFRGLFGFLWDRRLMAETSEV
jgi:3-oxo-5-alpha-steroid 4-dehydrogenase